MIITKLAVLFNGTDFATCRERHQRSAASGFGVYVAQGHRPLAKQPLIILALVVCGCEANDAWSPSKPDADRDIADVARSDTLLTPHDADANNRDVVPIIADTQADVAIDAGCTQDLDCMSGPVAACRRHSCDTATGKCVVVPIVDGGYCDDGNPCTTDDRCDTGACVPGAPIHCLPMDQCHVAGTCDPATGCSNPVQADGTTCNDNDWCTLTDTCSAGKCVGAAGGLVCTPITISEFFHGPGGDPADQFVEIYNNSDVAIDLGGYQLWSADAGVKHLHATVAKGTSLPPRGHFQFMPAGGPAPSVALTDMTYWIPFGNDSSVALLKPDGVTVVDQVGLTDTSPFLEGTPLAPFDPAEPFGRCYERRPGLWYGATHDTDDNAADFALVETCHPEQLRSSVWVDTHFIYLTAAVGEKKITPIAVTNFNPYEVSVIIGVSGLATGKFRFVGLPVWLPGPGTSIYFLEFTATTPGTQAGWLSVSTNRGGVNAVDLVTTVVP